MVSERIFVLTTDFYPMMGGVAEYLHNLWNNVAKHHRVTVITTVQNSGRSWNHNYELKVLSPLPERKLGNRYGDCCFLFRKINTARYFYALKKYAIDTIAIIRDEMGSNPKIFIGIWDLASHFWCREFQRLNIPYRLHVYGLEVVNPFYGRLPCWRNADFVHANEMLSVSRPTTNLVRKNFGNDLNICVVHPGVGSRPENDQIKERVFNLKQKLKLSDQIVILTVGRLIARKGIDLVLKCIPNLLVHFPNLQYIIAGDGPEKDRLQTMIVELGINHKVHFLGEVDQFTKWSLYELCDLFVMPNRLLGRNDWEGFGIVFLEAALAGKPSIGGKNGGVPDAIEDGSTGILINPEQEDALQNALYKLLSDEDLRQHMGRAGNVRTQRFFNWETIASEFCAKQGWS